MADSKLSAGKDGHHEIHVPSDTATHVDVARAEQEFNELSRQLSSRSREARSQQSSESSATAKDLEKAGDEKNDHFDLREYLTSSNDANQNAGIKHKVGEI